MSYCEDCRSKIGHQGCTWCNEESYIVDQYHEGDIPLPNDDSEFMKKYYEQQKKLNN